MDNSKQPASQPGRIPVLFDVVERGANAPEEDKIKPPPPAEMSEFQLDEDPPGSEDVTDLPTFGGIDDAAFSLDTSEEVTDEIPILSDAELKTGSSEFTLIEREDITEEISIIPPDMLKDGQTSADELVEQAMQELMPQLEALARKTLYQLTHTAETDEEDEQTE